MISQKTENRTDVPDSVLEYRLEKPNEDVHKILMFVKRTLTVVHRCKIITCQSPSVIWEFVLFPCKFVNIPNDFSIPLIFP